MFSRFGNIFNTKSASFMLSSWFFMDIKFMYDCSADGLSIKFKLLWKLDQWRVLEGSGNYPSLLSKS